MFSKYIFFSIQMSHGYQILAQSSSIKNWLIGMDIFQLGSATIKAKLLSIFPLCDMKNGKKLHFLPFCQSDIQGKFRDILVKLYSLMNRGPELSGPALQANNLILIQLFHTPTLLFCFTVKCPALKWHFQPSTAWT